MGPRKAQNEENKRIRKKRNERKLCEQLSHVDAFDTLLAFIMPWPVFVVRGSWLGIRNSKRRLPTLLLLLNRRFAF
jgi:hypothetical protein